jgi:IS30 family transposase
MQKLVEDFSPEQISKTVKAEYADEPLKWIFHETIYKYIYATPKRELRKVFTSHLRRKRRERKDSFSSHEQRGTNENTNGLLRQYFPKRTDFTKVTLEEIKFAQHRLNHRPRKVLNWQTPQQAFKKHLGALKT